MSESHHSHRSLHQLHSPDPNPLIIDHRHLSAQINSTISLQSSRSLTVWSQTFHVVLPDPLTFCLLTSCSSVPIPVLHRSCAPPSPRSAVPFGSPGKGKGHYHSDKPLETFPFPACLPGHSAHLIPFCCYSINLLFVLHLPLCPVSICWQKTRPEPTTGDGVSEPCRCGSPWGAGQRSSNSSLSSHTPSVCLCQSHGHPCKLFRWGGWM